MIKSWIIKGVPLIIQTSILQQNDKGLNLDILPKAIIKPKGIAPKRVTAKSFKVCIKPTFKASKTIGNCSKNVFIIILNYTETESAKSTLCFSFILLFNYLIRAAETPYFSASSSAVPSSIASSKNLLNSAASSESLRKPTPYSSLLRATVYVRSA